MNKLVNSAQVNRVWNTVTVCNVAGALSWQAQRQPDAAAIHYPVRSLLRRWHYASCSYYQLNELSNRYARGMAQYGIVAGTRTALMLKPGLEFFAVFFALFKAGAVPVLIDPGIGLPALKKCLGEASPQAFFGTCKAQLARKKYGWAKDSCTHFVTKGPALGLGGITLRQLRALGGNTTDEVLHPSKPDDMAAILFTSGSTGSPKGVVYRHRHFAAQVELLRQAFDIEPGEVSLPTFPPFALFDPALGMTTVVPRMDPTRPANANPQVLADAIDEFQVTHIFGSPALLDTLSRYIAERGKRLWSVKRVISAGAAVPLRTIRRMESALASDALIHTAYGATECLPLSSASNRQLDARVEALTESGEGVFVGKPIAPNQVRVIAISENAFADLSETTQMPPGMPGEIIVSGPTCTDSYWAHDEASKLAKIADGRGTTWHRMGDAGILDGSGCLWYCGRLAQRVETGTDTLFPDQVEAIFNQHQDVLRTALVGVGAPGRQIPVLCVELNGQLAPVDCERVHFDLLQLAQVHALTRNVRTVLFHPGFPVDRRHNSKIHREELALWAAKKMQE
ncbi:MAG TPA: fatty acid CoA ligase family protein [Xanthomonadales bacterium]|nr:fatty acid CoA ligase family protein [Xanthomonadales bacterium]